MVLLRSSDLLRADDLQPDGDQAGGGGAMAGAGSIGAGMHGGGSGDPRHADGPDPVGNRSTFLGELPADKLSLIDVEREIIVRALAKHGGNQSRTAEYLGIPRHVLLYRLEKFGIK
jgi:DNA-binding NtrC family response regulator